MKRETAERITKAIPSMFKNVLAYTKDNFDKKGQEILEGATGTIGVLINLFGKPLIDKYFDKQREKKLENFGLQTYLKAAFVQAGKSLAEIEGDFDDNEATEVLFEILTDSLEDQVKDFDKTDVLLIFQPRYHPGVLFVKDHYIRILRAIDTTTANIKKFQKHFNENIETQIQTEFGDDYTQHLEETKKYRLEENETHFLWDMKELGRIGFKETENLKYEETFARWKKVSGLKEEEKEEEKDLQPIEKLIDEYFRSERDNHLEKILFIIADFGKGKSVFLRHFASKLAKKYLETGEGDFPVYFNLRNFKNFSSEPRLGVISDYLETRYSIKVDDEYFRKKKYIFLIDSLDESGELTKNSTDKVISSIKNIQGIDKSIYKTNRLIITSRPFEEGLPNHLEDHRPHIIKNKEGRDIEYFISIYGFTESQFNDWLLESLKVLKDPDNIQATGFAQKIIESIKNQKEIDIYEELVEKGTLSESELRRPIFAYMVYQLILNNIDFSALGKIGVYLSFLNLLTKEAKHIHDTGYRINLKEEFEFRNLLHAIAALWMYERQQGRQGALKKADICRVLDGENKDETDEQVLERYKNKGVVEIQFLSHSYFGESENVLHFQHQSFAEILLAEYYLKVLIKYALDEEFDVEEARTKLLLGEPSEQTIQFLKEMLRLLRETAVKDVTEGMLERRKLLFPLMASLATQKNNNLFCHDIHYSWYKRCKIPENQTEYPVKSLKNWCIRQEEIDRIVNLAREIMESKTNYLMTRADVKTALYNKEILAVRNNKLSNFPPDMDRWLALLVGNELFNDEENERFFNGKIKNFEHLFDLIRNWNYAYGESTPWWGRNLFRGIDMRENNDRIDLSGLSLSFIDFSYSYLKNFKSGFSYLNGCDFRYTKLKACDFALSRMYKTDFSQIKHIVDYLNIDQCIISGFVMPDQLRSQFSLTEELGHYVNYGSMNGFINHEFGDTALKDIFFTLEGLLTYGLQHQLFTVAEIKTWFQFESEEDKKEFFQMIDGLKKYEVKKTKRAKRGGQGARGREQGARRIKQMVS